MPCALLPFTIFLHSQLGGKFAVKKGWGGTLWSAVSQTTCMNVYIPTPPSPPPPPPRCFQWRTEEMEPFLEVAHQWRNWGGDYMRGMCPQSWRWGVGECSLPLPLLYLPCSAGTGIDFTGDWSLQGLSVLAGNAMLEASDWSLNSELSWFSGVIMIKKIGGE